MTTKSKKKVGHQAELPLSHEAAPPLTRLEKNRIHAKKSRERKEAHLQYLETRVLELEAKLESTSEAKGDENGKEGEQCDDTVVGPVALNMAYQSFDKEVSGKLAEEDMEQVAPLDENDSAVYSLGDLGSFSFVPRPTNVVSSSEHNDILEENARLKEENAYLQERIERLNKQVTLLGPAAGLNEMSAADTDNSQQITINDISAPDDSGFPPPFCSVASIKSPQNATNPTTSLCLTASCLDHLVKA